MRYYDTDDLDVEVARVTDEDGNPVQRGAEREVAHQEGGRTFTHVNVRYCIS